MRIAQISDFHFTHITWNPLRLLSKRILGNLNWLFTRKAFFAPEQLDPLPELFRKLNVDLILLGGDFTTTALEEEFLKAQEFVSKFSQPWIAIPGNHDHYTAESWREKHFYRYFSNKRAPISHPIDFFTLKEHGVEAHKIGDGWWVLALDTARATNFYSSQGLLSLKLEEYVSEILSLIPPQDAVICLNHYPFFPQEEARRGLVRGEALRALLEKSPQIRLYLNGHTHRHAIADLQPNKLPILLDSGCCVQGGEGTWNLIDLLQGSCEVTAFHWKTEWEPFRKESIAWQRK
jgi:3',5'-cyclic AMP phosphodiesterase CpdA